MAEPVTANTGSMKEALAGVDAAHPVIVFDGVCVLCNAWFRFVSARDGGRYRFAAMQGEAGRALLTVHGLNADDPATFLLIEDGAPWTDSTAALRIIAKLGSGWQLLARIVALVPKRLRDAAYRVTARNRYRLFGRHAQCPLPTPAERLRLL